MIVIAELRTFDPKMGAALLSQLRLRVRQLYRQSPRPLNGLAEEQVAALRTGIPTSNVKIDPLTGLVRDAAANSGNVTDATWKAAQQDGWSDARCVTSASATTISP